MRVLVLLSVWNGAKYIDEQLASILAQEVDASLSLLIRDDGSRDGSLTVIESMVDKRIKLVRGANVGARASFLLLLDAARSSGADFVALADHDDVWLPGKLQRAIDLLRHADGPAIYGSPLNLTDERLQPIGTYAFGDTPNFEGALFANCLTGCTCVLNRDFLSLLDPQPAANAIMMHDWWLYLVGAAFGNVIYDTESHILYRQHVSNQVGMRERGLAAILHRARKFTARGQQPNRIAQAREFLRIYGASLTPARRNYIHEFLACEHRLLHRLRFALRQRPRRRHVTEDAICFTKLLLGWF